jgi:hypothetical protein
MSTISTTDKLPKSLMIIGGALATLGLVGYGYF